MTAQSTIDNPQSSIKASAPGSLMLLGEHAVLHGRRALVCAINQRITVSVFQCLEKKLKIFSDLGTYEAPLGDLADHPDFRFVLDAVRQVPLEHGIELKIESEFSSDIGFGSSAAVTVATHAALMQLNSGSLGEFAPPFEIDVLGRATPPAEPFLMELFKRSLATIHRVQGRGSGADVAASVFGGVVAYRAEPLEIHPMPESFPLTAVYSGSKMKTADVIRYLEERRALNPDYFERIFDRMDASVGEVIDGFSRLGPMLILNQKLMEEMGLCNAALAEIIRIFQTLEIPAKISGSGLGDCAIGLGKVLAIGNFKAYFLQVERVGVSM
jgi:mevalonate kinase